MNKLLIAFIFLCACKVQPLVSTSKTVLLDTYYNNEVNAKTGQPFHYLWTDTAMSGFSQLGKVFNSYGAILTSLPAEPTAQSLDQAGIYIIVDPDTEAETSKPNYMTERAAASIADWVKKGGVLLMLTNDSKNAELDRFNMLAAKFEMHFNNEVMHPVNGKNWNMGAAVNLPAHPLFTGVNKIYLKEISSITCTGMAKPVLTENENVFIAEASYGKGYVLAVGDPWLYNEYIDHWVLPEDFDNKKAAINMVKLLLQKSRK